MEEWKLHAFKIVRSTVGQKRVSEDTLPVYPGEELAVSFTSYPDIDLEEYTMYFKVHWVAFEYFYQRFLILI